MDVMRVVMVGEADKQVGGQGAVYPREGNVRGEGRGKSPTDREAFSMESPVGSFHFLPPWPCKLYNTLRRWINQPTNTTAA
jgi:hypothetical protein